jgi:ABC-type phosphate/phosphonate transport system substrate-binding protein
MASASLPMYDLPELRTATDAWWQGLAKAFRRAGLREVPDRLRRDGAMEAAWRAPDLLFSQTCGYPLTHAFRGLLRPVATPAYAAPGCDGPLYASAIVVRADDPAQGPGDLAGRICAVNNRASHSGYNALRRALAPHAVDGRFAAGLLETGGHMASLAAVAEGRAGLAAIDCVTLELLARHRPAAVAGLRVLAWSERAPGLPYVTRADAGEEALARLRDGLRAALADPALAGPRQALLLRGAEPLDAAAYGRIDEMEAEAAALGYPEVA